MPDTLLSVRQLTKRYGTVDAVTDLTFDVAPGEVYGLLGPNGAGKSTTLNSIVGLTIPSEGTILLGEADAATPEGKGMLGFVPDELRLPGTLTGREYILFVERVYGINEPARATALVSMMGLKDVLDRLIREYSHGMHKKLQFVGALLHDPSVLVLDEPFGGLDPEAMHVVRRIIEMRRGQARATLIATHDLPFATRICDRVGIIARGRLVAEGTVAAVLAAHGSTDLEDVYFKASGLGGRIDSVDGLLDAAFPESATTTTGR
ncbi:MAG: ABC transporter ATP-binding protein [Coriobacteriia bacterium]